MFRVFALLALCVLTGCSRAQLEHQSDSLNRATAMSMSEQVLLNAIRASLDMPMSFTKLQKFTANSMMTGSVGSRFPFGVDATGVFEVSPAVNVSSGVFQIDYVDVNTAGALTKLNQTLQYTDMERYLSDGHNPYVITTMFTRTIEIHAALAAALKRQKEKFCRMRGAHDFICNEIAEIERSCGLLWYNRAAVMLEDKQQYLLIHNRAHTRCEYQQFQVVLWTLGMSGFYTDLVQQETYETIKTPEGKTQRVSRMKVSEGLRFQTQEVQDVSRKIDVLLRSKKLTHRAPVKLVLRSARSVLSYMGDLIALQNFSADRYIPQTITWTGAAFLQSTMFRVIHGTPAGESAALSVTDDHGRRFYVPHPAYGALDRDQTLRVLSIATEVVNAAISEKDFPAPTSVVLRAIQ